MGAADNGNMTMTFKAPKPAARSRVWWWLPLLVAVVALSVWRMAGGRKEPKIEYRTAEAQRGNLVVQVTATGNLEPTNQLLVGIEVSGTIRSVEVEHNDFVKAGQVLARLDTDRLEAQVQQSKATLESARAKVLLAESNLEEADRELKRMQQLRKASDGRLPSQYDYDTIMSSWQRSKAEKVVAEATRAEAEAKLEINQTDLRKAHVRSPIDGVVLKRSVEPGQTVAASFQAPELFTLAEDLTKMELQVNVDEADVGLVQSGQPAIFMVDAYPDRQFPAAISQVRYGSEVSEGVVTYLTILNVDNSDLSLRPGMTATADIEVQRVENALLIPSAALRFSPPPQEDKEMASSGGSLLNKLFPRPTRRPKPVLSKKVEKRQNQQVWVLRDQQPLAIPVTIGASSGTMTEVVKGELEPGAAVIVEAISGREK